MTSRSWAVGGYEGAAAGCVSHQANGPADITICGMATPIPPYHVVEELRAAHWSGDPQQLREAIWSAQALGVRTWQIARELRTTPRRVKAAITFNVL